MKGELLIGSEVVVHSLNAAHPASSKHSPSDMAIVTDKKFNHDNNVN